MEDKAASNLTNQLKSVGTYQVHAEFWTNINEMQVTILTVVTATGIDLIDTRISIREYETQDQIIPRHLTVKHF